MESLIEEFSLEHIRTNRGIYYLEENAVVLKLHDAWLPTLNLFT
jgi:hypothetical protein